MQRPVLGVILLEKYKLGKPFDLGAEGTFSAPDSGELYVRCAEAWGQLADNAGSINMTIKPATARSSAEKDGEDDREPLPDVERRK